ncbi:unnamed protein product [Ectocarpus sp. CCAP 1310/34]|nr:unnamed protein product [Ectocarpus sp. CCAP 1310/34]
MCFVKSIFGLRLPDPRRCHIKRPVLYLKDGVEELQLQDEWDQREMLQTQQARRRDADPGTRAEVETWGCETDATGAVFRSGRRSQDSAILASGA